MKISRFLAATALSAFSIVAPAAIAQTTQPAQDCKDANGAAIPCPLQDGTTQPATEPVETARGTATGGASAGPGDVVVTGTRINRPNISSPVPITSLNASELLNRGTLSVGDALDQLPQLRATFTQSNSTRFIGTAGISALDLRGLGTARTLVLLDGRRLITATPGINRPDVNTIPNDLLDRVDIVTGGNSAIYGSDAVAGVVNFTLKNNYEGLRIRSQGGITSRGDRGSYFGSLTAGQNFAEGRGNLAFSVEYAKQNTVLNTDRDEQTGAYSGRSQFQLTQNTGPNLNPSAGIVNPNPEAATGDGISDTTFLTGIKNNNISNGGLFTAACPNAAAAGESAAAFAARRATACSGLANPASANPLAQFGRTYVFLGDGSLVANPCAVDFRPAGSSNCQGGLGSTLRETGFVEPGLDRAAFNVLGHYDVSPAFTPFFHLMFVHVNANQEGQPTFFNNSFSINNPFLTPQARATLVANLAPGATTFTAQRFNTDFGGRGEQHRRDTYQGTIGVRGTFLDTWKYEVNFNYGHLYTFYRTNGNLVRAKYANSINAVRNAAGQIVCGINADAITTNDDPACVPVNLFGEGQVSQAALNYFGYTSSRTQKANLYDGTAYVAGDLSKVFSLPGGPIAFVLGGEYRKENAFAAYDPLTSSTACGTAGCTFLNVIPDFRPPQQITKEAFGQISIPLLKGTRFAEQLTIDAAGRFSNYNIGKTGTVFAWNVSGVYAPVRDLLLRAGYARAIRAPTISDLYATNTQTFLNGLVDPCGQQNINNNPNRVKNCAAAGVPLTQTFAGVTEPFSNRAGSGISGFNGGNPNLDAETSDSLTAGGVFQPHFVPGLSVSVDYYRIKIKNVIFSLLPQTIINQCYDSPSGINNPFCAAVFRNANGTFAGQSDVLNNGTTISLTPTGPSFLSAPFNFARQETSGIDVDLNYRHDIFEGGRFTFRGLVSRTFTKTNYTDVTRPNYGTRQLEVLGDPQWQAQVSANLQFSGVNLGYRVRYIGRQVVAGTYETQNSFQGRPPENPDAFPFVFYPDVTYHDFRLDLTPNKKFGFYLGVDNAFDKLPPYDLIGTEAADPFDPVGRFFYAGVEVKF